MMKGFGVCEGCLGSVIKVKLQGWPTRVIRLRLLILSSLEVFQTMNGLDWVLLAIGAFCILRGILRGAVSQVFGIAGVIGGFVLASHYYQPLANQLGRSFPNLSGTGPISFLTLFFLTWFCLGAVGYAVGNLLKKTGMGFLDRIWGGGVGFVKAVVLSAIIVSVMTLLLSSQNSLLRDSRITPFVQEAAVLLVAATPPSVQKLFEQKKKELEAYWTQRRGRIMSAPLPFKGETGIRQ